MMWREQIGITEMLFTYMGNFQEFSGWTNWRKILVDILTCHEESRRLQASFSREPKGSLLKSQTNSDVDEKNSSTLFYGQNWISHSDEVTPSTIPEIKYELDAMNSQHSTSFDWQQSSKQESISEDIQLITGSISRMEDQTYCCDGKIDLPAADDSWIKSQVDQVDASGTNEVPVHQSSLEQQRAGYVPTGMFQSGFPLHFSPDTHTDPPQKRKPRRSHACTFCGRLFINSNHLKAHVRSHTGERPYPCTICGKSFIVSYHLKRHMRTHTGEKPHICNICGKSFTEDNALTNHLRIHTGERPYVCEICGRSFAHRNVLKIHSRVHTGEKPYKCTYPACDKSFAQNSGLHVHMRTHTSERVKTQCPVCHKGFTTANYLKFHMAKAHGTESIPSSS